MRDVCTKMRTRVLNGIAVSGEGRRRAEVRQSIELLEVDGHVSFAGRDEDRSHARHHVAHDDRTRSFLMET